MAPENTTVTTVPNPVPPAGSSPANPHTHVKVIDELHELYGKVCKIISTDATFIVVELESVGSWIKAKLFHSQVAIAPAPVVVPPVTAVTETTETTATTPAVETAPVAEVPPVVETAPVPEAAPAS